MAEAPDVKLEQVSITGMHVTVAVMLDGKQVGTLTVAKYYQPVVKVLSPYVALWAGPTLCVIDATHREMSCVDRDDETHRIHRFENRWIVEGELRIDLFDPATLKTSASYGHDEVITDSWFDGDLVCIRDFQNRTFSLDPRRNLQLATTPSSPA